MKRFVLACFTLTLLLAQLPAQSAIFSVQEIECATPEYAIQELLSGLKENDLTKILRVSALNELADHFDFAKMSARLNAIVPTTFKMPPSSDFNVMINRMEFIGFLGRQLKMLSYSLLTDLRTDGTTIYPVDPVSTEALIKQVDSTRLGGIDVVSIDFPVSGLQNNERLKKNSIDQAAPLGADDSTERLVLIKFEGRYFFFGVHLLRYGKNWRIDSLNSSLAGTSILGNAEVTTQEDYERAIGE